MDATLAHHRTSRWLTRGNRHVADLLTRQLTDRPGLPYARLCRGFRPAGDAGSRTVANSHLMQLALVGSSSEKTTFHITAR
jgi:hypothetical protein